MRACTFGVSVDAGNVTDDNTTTTLASEPGATNHRRTPVAEQTANTENAENTEQGDQPAKKSAAKKSTAKKAAQKGPSAGTRAAVKKVGDKLEGERQERIAIQAIDKAHDTLMDAFEDADHPGHAEAVAYFEDLAARLDDERGIEKPTDVFTALWAVMRDVRYVGKNGRNEDQNYPFRGIDDVMNALGPAMRRHGLLMFPKVMRRDHERFPKPNNKFGTAVQVDVRYRFLFAPGGKDDYVDVEVPGESIDASDKATAKAMSVALRTAMLQTFALPTYDTDPDQHNPEIQAPQPLTAEEVQAAAGWAADQLDLDAAFLRVRESFGGRPMEGVVLTTKAGTDMNPDEYLTYVQEQVTEQRARKEAEAARAQQDADAHGDAQETRNDDAHEDAQPARTEDAQPAQGRDFANAQEATEAARERAQEAPAQEQAAQRPGPNAWVKIAKDELEFQAKALGVDFSVHAQSVLAEDGRPNFNRCVTWIPKQRPLVCEALREQGHASAADAYEHVGNAFPIKMGVILEGIDQADRDALANMQPQGAQQ